MSSLRHSRCLVRVCSGRQTTSAKQDKRQSKRTLPSLPRLQRVLKHSQSECCLPLHSQQIRLSARQARKTESADSPLGVLAKSLVEDLRGEALLKAAKTKLQTEPQEPQSNEEVQSEDNFRCSAQRPQANQAGSETAEKDSAASQGGPLQEDGKLQPRKPAGENPSQASTGAVNVQSTSTSVGLLARPGREEPLSKELPADNTALDAGPAASQEPASLTRQEKKKEFYGDPATELVFRLSKQLKTVESDVEADRVFQQTKAACEQHPLFGQWVREVQEDVNCEDGLEEEERWVVWEQEPDEDLLCFRCFLKRQAGLPECSSDGEVSVTSQQEASVEDLLRAMDTVDSSGDEVSQFRRSKKRISPQEAAPPSPADSWEHSDKEVLSPCLEKLHEPEGFKSFFHVAVPAAGVVQAKRRAETQG